jgi:Zn ribbon nucleic-acid-binding protein
MIKERFRKYLKSRCPDCDNKELRLMDYIDEEDGVSYCETFIVCPECGYEKNVSDKRNKNNKIEE